MFTTIDDMPAGAIGFAASGVVTAADRSGVLEPTIGSALAEGGRVRLLYVAGEDFAGYDAGMPLDEAVFGSRHFADFAKIALVSDTCSLRRAVRALDGLMPAELRVFRQAEVETAKLWLAA
ncbi:MAG: STAS/SEC14 domain-containing protein [Rhizobiales bacterium]|nr:STAS/SEC14 domain-containing protein [Hyphomicrobiales bacterium]